MARLNEEELAYQAGLRDNFTCSFGFRHECIRDLGHDILERTICPECGKEVFQGLGCADATMCVLAEHEHADKCKKWQKRHGKA